MTVTLCTSQPSRSMTTLTMQLTGLLAVVHVAGHVAGLVEVLLGDVAAAVGVDDQQLVAAELGGVLRLQPVAHVVGLGGVVHHDEQDRLAGRAGSSWSRYSFQRSTPAVEIRLVAGAGDLGLLLGDARGDALERALDDVVDDRLLERVVVDRPGEELRPCCGAAWR